jgi:hypothetical protein
MLDDMDFDFEDIDIDLDGIPDSVDGFISIDGDFIDDSTDLDLDLDLNGIPDRLAPGFLDLDIDGIPDQAEPLGPDLDGDFLPDWLDPFQDLDADGISDGGFYSYLGRLNLLSPFGD